MRNPPYPPSSLAFDWVMAALAALLMCGVIQDGWAHAHGLVDQSFFTPWHAIMYSCMAINGVALATIGLRNLARGYTFSRGLPYGYWTSLTGVIVFATGGVFDLFWHTLYGIETDITGLISVSHLWLAVGGALVFVGPLRSIAHRYDANSGGWKVVGPAILSVIALLMLLGFFTQYASPLADNTDESILAPNRGGITGGELYSVHLDGSNETRLLTIAKHDIWGAAISPDGKHVAYRVQTGRTGGIEPSDIYVANSDGTHAVRITHSGRHDTQIAWSPDGKRLAYVSMPAGTSGNFSIITLNRDGSAARTIVDGTTTVQNPSWSPDGTSIVYQSRNGLHQQLAVIPANGGTPQWLASTMGGSEPFWSRNGSIVFSKDDGTLGVTDASGVNGKRLKLQGSESAASPDGKRIAYTSNDNGAAQIFVANADGSHPVDVTRLAAQDASHAAWRSDGELVFTSAGRAQPIYTSIGKAYSEDAFIISTVVLMGLLLMLVRRWRMPLGSMTAILTFYSIALATQSDTYFDIAAAIATGILADVLLAALKDGARTGMGFYAFSFIVPFVMSATYIIAVSIHDGGLGWPPNMIFGTPFIAGFVGLLISYCFASPLSVREPSSLHFTLQTEPAAEHSVFVVQSEK